MNWIEARIRAVQKQTAVYRYRDEQGRVLYEVVRYEPKDFRQRVPLQGGGYRWRLDGVRRVPYRLPELLAADPLFEVFIVEGEKDADLLASVGCVTTTNVGGAGQWKPEYAPWLKDRSVVIIPDNDEPGKRHAEQVARSLVGVASRISILELPGLGPKGDVSDFMRGDPDARMTELVRLMLDAPDWKPKEETTPGITPGASMREFGTGESPELYVGGSNPNAGITPGVKPGASVRCPRVGESPPQFPQNSDGVGFEGIEGGSGGSGPQSPDDWPDLIRLEEPELPHFPVDGLPEPLAAARSLEIPVDMPAMIGLAIGGLCLSGRAIVRPLPDWTESPNLYAMIVLDPGERKSQTVRRMIEPLERFETEENDRRSAGIRQSQQRRSLLEKRIEKLTARAAAEDQIAERQKLEEMIHQSDRELSELEMVHSIRLLTNDVTPERLAALLAQNEGRIGIIGAEGDVLDIIGGRYSSDGRSNLGTVLAGYSGDTIRVDRQNREPVLVRDPAITICLAIQYDVLKSLKRDKSFRGRGLLARFCYCQPRSMIGERSIHAEPIPESVAARYGEIVTRLLRHSSDSSGPRILQLTPDAMAQLNGFRADVEYRLRKDGGDLSPIADWGSKLPGMVVRIAAIIHAFSLPDDPFGQSIGPDAMEAAVRIGEYLIDHARAAFQCMGGDPEIELAQRIAGVLHEYAAVGLVSKRDLFLRFKGTTLCRTTEDIHRPLEILIQYGYLKHQPKGPGKSGRPSERFLVRKDL